MTGRDDIRSIVWEIVRRRAPHVPATVPDADCGPLGAGGVGLDSIAMAEVLLDVEEAFGIDAQALLHEGGVITFERLFGVALRASPT
jgi:hypothetical protein